MNKYIELMITNMKELGAAEKGVDLSTVRTLRAFPSTIHTEVCNSSDIPKQQWLDLLCMDTAADLAYSWQMNQVRDSMLFCVPTTFAVLTDGR